MRALVIVSPNRAWSLAIKYLPTQNLFTDAEVLEDV